MRIRGLGVIEDAVLELSPGLNVLSGETGAGKTMVVTGLGLLFGGRADAGASVVVVLHELGPFAPLIDRVVALREGRVTYDGPPDQLAEGAAHGHHHPDHGDDAPVSMQAPLEGDR